MNAIPNCIITNSNKQLRGWPNGFVHALALLLQTLRIPPKKGSFWLCIDTWRKRFPAHSLKVLWSRRIACCFPACPSLVPLAQQKHCKSWYIYIYMSITESPPWCSLSLCRCFFWVGWTSNISTTKWKEGAWMDEWGTERLSNYYVILAYFRWNIHFFAQEGCRKQ